MVEYLGHPAESFLRIRQRRIHGDQGVIELPQRLHSGTIRWDWLVFGAVRPAGSNPILAT